MVPHHAAERVEVPLAAGVQPVLKTSMSMLTSGMCRLLPPRPLRAHPVLHVRAALRPPFRVRPQAVVARLPPYDDAGSTVPAPVGAHLQVLADERVAVQARRLLGVPHAAAQTSPAIRASAARPTKAGVVERQRVRFLNGRDHFGQPMRWDLAQDPDHPAGRGARIALLGLGVRVQHAAEVPFELMRQAVT